MKRTVNLFIVLSFLLLPTFVKAKEKIHHLNWQGLPVTWLESQELPLYNVVVYFADGALSEGPGEKGQSSAMFDLLSSGTRRYSQKDISDNLEFFGASYGSNVTHEYSTFSVSGLVKDIVPTMKMICHLFKDARFPEAELVKEKRRAITSLKDLVSSHSALAERAFRELSLGGTPYAYPVGGKMSDIKALSSSKLKKKLDYYNHQVKKQIFITGPSAVMAVMPIMMEDCSWGSPQDKLYTRRVKDNEGNKKARGGITLVSVPKSNQAQVRFGKFLSVKNEPSDELMDLTGTFLGGGFTSRLMRELRVKRGLTYSVHAYAATQREYGRSVISTFTKNETVSELIKLTQDVITQVANKELDEKDFLRSRSYLYGSYPFRFEKSSAYLAQIIDLFHRGKDLEELYDYQKNVMSLGIDDVAKASRELYLGDDLSIVVIGSEKLLPQLKTLGPVRVVNYNKFL